MSLEMLCVGGNFQFSGQYSPFKDDFLRKKKSVEVDQTEISCRISCKVSEGTRSRGGISREDGRCNFEDVILTLYSLKLA